MFGETARLENNSEAATHSFNLALSIYEKLGNKSAAERLRQLLPTVNQPIFKDEESTFAVRFYSIDTTLRAELSAGETALQKKIMNSRRFVSQSNYG